MIDTIDMMMMFVAIAWTTIIAHNIIIYDTITAYQFNWWKLRGYKLGRVCLYLCWFIFGVLIWGNALGYFKEFTFSVIFLWIAGVLFFLLWFFGFRIVETQAMFKRFEVGYGN